MESTKADRSRVSFDFGPARALQGFAQVKHLSRGHFVFSIMDAYAHLPVLSDQDIQNTLSVRRIYL